MKMLKNGLIPDLNAFKYALEVGYGLHFSLSVLSIMNKELTAQFEREAKFKVDKRIQVSTEDCNIQAEGLLRLKLLPCLLMINYSGIRIEITWTELEENCNLSSETFTSNEISFQMTVPSKDQILKCLNRPNPATGKPYTKPRFPKNLPFNVDYLGMYGEGSFTIVCVPGTDM